MGWDLTMVYEDEAIAKIMDWFGPRTVVVVRMVTLCNF